MGKVLIYLVHGLGVESAEEWWGTTKETLEDYFKEESYNVEFKYFNYKTRIFENTKNKFLNIFGKGDVLAPLDDIGRNFISQLAADESVKSADSIIFFCHSMGGLVAANALNYVKSIDSLNFLSYKITHIILCGTPLGGSNLASRAKYLPKHKSLHIKELLKDKCSRQIVSLKLKEITSLNGSENTNISFIRISEDQVVKTDEERYGVFYNQLEGIETPTITGTHSGSVQNLNESNVKIIKRHLIKCLDSEICKNRSKEISEIDEQRQQISHCYTEYTELNEDYKKKLIDLLIRKQIDKIKTSTEIENKFIDLKIFYRKTFLSILSKKNENDSRKVILDINRKIKVINSGEDIFIEFYAGFEKKSPYANKKFVEDLITDLRKSMNNPNIDRFKEYALKVKKKEGENDSLLQVHNVELEYCDTKKNTIGFTIKINIGRYSSYDEVELLLSYTLPTTIWLECCKNIPDTIVLPANVLESEVIIQEEIYNDIQPMLAPRVVKKDVYRDVKERSFVSLYYKTYQAKKFFHYGTQPNDAFKITVEMEQQ